MPDRPYTGRRWRFLGVSGTVCSEPFSIQLGQANGNGLTGEYTHGCVAVSLDPEYRADANLGANRLWIGTIIGHIDDVEK